jgi:hypothetical protein
MSAKEKASNLVDKFLDLDNYNNLNLDLFCDECGMSNEAAKICALIAVNEMIDIRNGLYINEDSIAHQWLLDVKHEIEKL